MNLFKRDQWLLWGYMERPGTPIYNSRQPQNPVQQSQKTWGTND